MRTALDTVSAAFVALLLGITAVAGSRIPDAPRVAGGLLAAITGYAVAAALARRVARPTTAATIHALAALALFGYLFGAMAPFHHVLVAGWRDEALLAVERSLTGVDVSVAMQRWVSPALTEWMMFSYMIYVPLLPGMVWLCRAGGGADAVWEYALLIAITFTVCFTGFMLYPLASPLFHAPERYSVPLQGGFFTWTSQLLRTHLHYPGGSLPSPHCAAGTIMLVMFWRYRRRWFIVAAPVIGSLYVATVYGRFHYATDGVAGILTAALVVAITPAIARGIAQVRVRAIALAPQARSLSRLVVKERS